MAWVPTGAWIGLDGGAVLAAEENVRPTIFFVVVFDVVLAIVEGSIEREDIPPAVELFYDLAEAGAEATFKAVWGVMEYGVAGVFALVGLPPARPASTRSSRSRCSS